MPSTSLSGYEYYVTFIDDYSRKTWNNFFKTKDEVFRKIHGIQSIDRESFRKKNQDTQNRQWWGIYFKIV